MLQRANPNRSLQRRELEYDIQQWINENKDYQVRSTIKIPVVIHVLYEKAGQNISDAQILSQIKVLNQDFNRTNPDTADTPEVFKSIAGKANIEFAIATLDPQGQKTNGIIRKKTTVKGFSAEDDDIKFSSKGGDDAWPTTKYFNIWIGNLLDDLLGYAEFPASQATNTFGLVINYNACGTVGNLSAPYDGGRTGTHETGHALGLYHIWGDEPGCDMDDEIADTPLQKAENSGCPTFPLTTDTGGRCDSKDPSSMFMNYMDYTNDACMNMFSKQQVNRMLAVLNIPPYHALKSSNPFAVSVKNQAGDLEKIKNIKIYPNPSNGDFYIDLSNMPSLSYCIYNAIGVKVYSQNLESNSGIHKIPYTDFTNGFYFIELKINNQTHTQKLVVK